MMKSEIDLQIKKGVPEPVVWGCQIFGGYDLTFYLMDMRVPQVYCLLKVFTGTLPKSIEDLSGVGRMISAFFYVEERITK
ncbi:hypothetical protein BGZ96_010248 [Linnemannia gamsii]|uniref:Uncharacterized protein n=1 Tax=Linnemannia gamsii TaxID=64522 RepID=A0ABQ7KC23_9FUNG|nr:hypothetical protein BGZ96_010248 [Linnemannia gamsii]